MAPQLISYTELPRKVSPVIPLVLNRSSSEILMKKVIGLFSPLVNYYIVLEIHFIYAKFK